MSPRNLCGLLFKEGFPLCMMYCYLQEGRQHGGRRYVYALLCKIKSIFRVKRMKFHCCKRAACILILRGSRVLQKMHGRRSWDVDGCSSHSHVARVHEPKLRFEYRNISLIIPLRIVFSLIVFFLRISLNVNIRRDCPHEVP